MKAVLVANPKWGSGKTTLSINVAGYLATRRKQVLMLDMGRQTSERGAETNPRFATWA